ncbi:Fungal transcriptional regulatory protein [Cordyceps fumosorosea ARSEF 2679]|uniref:Fungal transcriptional regulatory protein n=1 Tax=Cordyceps fumosorosea (strain ARSEF 2679) TaxID=1081104 RepID=A0A168D950_CORFA|nr:Fungal transcriptional regulatory protein [Cordyceps fumosorosea ARSEF 2679]OAA72310.1 Fungal transcriptional regulatory protein [Cordyceps fumosorosea ARSEF 2679]
MPATAVDESEQAATAAASSDSPKSDIACLICRSRKVRCDRSLPDCRNCLRLGVPCPRYDRENEFISRKELQKSADDIFRAAGVEKRKVGSCEECRASKHRCTKTRPACRRCILRNLTCTYPGKQEREPSISGSLSPGRQGHGTTPTKPEPRDTYTPMEMHPIRPEPDHRQFQPLNRQNAHTEEPPVPMNYQQAQYQLPQLRHHQEPTNTQSHMYNHNALPNGLSNYTHQPMAHDSYHQVPPHSLSSIPQYQQPPRPSQQHIQPQQNLKTKGPLPDILAQEPEGVYSERLPENRGFREILIKTYFNRSAPLRNLSFIHKPSFMKSLDQDSVVQDYGEPLLYVMCALGARHLYFDHVAECGEPMVVDANQVPGEKWAVKARQDAMRDLHTPDVHNLMTMVLLCDYSLREDKNAMVFVLISVLYRMVRLLSLDSYRPLDPDATPTEIMERESEIRLVWACYYLDVLVGNGVEKNLCWRDDVPAIPLPCPEQSFTSQTASQPYFLEDIERNDLADVVPHLDFQALSILILRLRSKVMHLIRTPEKESKAWDNDSKFLQIISRLETILAKLPEKYLITDINMYILREDNILGAVFVLHLLMHAVIFDLTRTSLAGFNFPLSNDFKVAPEAFKTKCQDLCRQHAMEVSQLFRRALYMGRSAFDDLFCVDAAFESSKVQLVYAATVNHSPFIVQQTKSNLGTNIECLQTFSRDTATRNSVLRALLPICTLFGFREIAEKFAPSGETPDESEVTGSADMHHLSRLAPFRRGRSELQRASHASHSPKTPSSSNTYPSPMTQSSRNVPPRSAHSQNAAPFNGMVPMVMDGNMGPIAAPGPSQRPPLQIMPSAGVMAQNGAMLQPSIDDYIKTADEMSNLLTWNMPDLSPWFTFDNMLLPS